MRARRRVLLWLMAFVAIVAIGSAVWAVWFSTVFAIERVRVVGIDGDPATQVLAEAGVGVGLPMARVDADGIASRIAALPWVGAVEVRRGWPHDIVLAIEPRVAVARLAGTASVVDAGGSAFEPVTPLPSRLPSVSAQGPALVAALTVLGSLPGDLSTRVATIQAATPDSVELTLRNGALVRWGSADQGPAKVEVLRALLPRRPLMIDVSAPTAPSTFGERGQTTR